MAFNVYRNGNAGPRNYECTNIMACEVIEENAAVPMGYQPVDQDYIENLQPLFVQAGVRYYGYL